VNLIELFGAYKKLEIDENSVLAKEQLIIVKILRIMTNKIKQI
jgi:hypothetical protein